MPGFPRPFASDDADDDTFDEYDEFRPDHLPEPGPFLDEAHVLSGDDHVDFHRLTREIFEERGVYDATFGYNLARLNLDARHPDAGFRYAVTTDAPDVLLAEFTPTTKFCTQSNSLTVGALRAWNGLTDRHDYERVSVAVAPMHHQSMTINEKLRDLEDRLRGGASEGEPVDEDGSVIGKHADRIPDDQDGPSTPF